MGEQAMVFIVGETIFVLMLYIAMGFFMRKINIIDDRVSQGLTGIFMIASLPAAIFNGMLNQQFDQNLLINILIVFSAIIAAYFVFAFVGLAIGRLFKLPRPRIGVYAMAMSFGNVGLMGFPVIGALWGGIGLFYGVVVTLAYFVMLPTMGVWLTVKSAQDDNGEPIKYRLKPNVALFASILGLLYYVTQEFIPTAIIGFIRPAVIDGVGGGPVGMFIGGVSATMTPISMFMIGSLLAKGKLKAIWGEVDILVLSAVKLLLVPILLFFTIRPFIADPIVLGVLVIQTAMPAASLSAVYAEKYKADSAYASRAVLISTALSLATIPAVALLLG